MTVHLPFLQYRGLLLIAAGLAAILTGCVTLQESGKKAFIIISEQQEAQMGAAAFQDLKKSSKISTDPAANALVRRVADRLIAQVKMPNTHWEVVVIDDDTPNAFALPGGKIGVHTGILPLTQTDDGLAVVIGHEIAHVTLRHGAQRVSQQLAVAGVATITDITLAMNEVRERQAIMTGLGLGATIGIILPYSRTHEYEADEYGLYYTARAGYDPEAAIGFWERMMAYAARSGGKPPEWLSTHPADANRIARMRAIIPEIKARVARERQGS